MQTRPDSTSECHSLLPLPIFRPMQTAVSLVPFRPFQIRHFPISPNPPQWLALGAISPFPHFAPCKPVANSTGVVNRHRVQIEADCTLNIQLPSVT